MSVEIKVPNLPESVSDATVAKWHKQPGDFVARDENLVDLETDKVVLEVPAPADGILKEIVAEAGETVTEGQALGVLEEGEAPEKPAESEASEGDAKADAAPAKAAAGESAQSGGAPSPSAKRAAAEHQVDTSEVQGSGRGGRVTKPDVMRHAAGGGARPEERVKMSRLRSRIAERMKEAQNTAAILTSFNEVNLQAVMDIRARYKDEFAQKHGVKLGFMSFFVKACCEALQKHPVVNASVDGDEIIYHGYQDVGIAVSTDRGLLVPILRNAESMSLAEIEAAIADYATQARKGTIQLEDLQGGTFTITNGGVFGSLISTPLLNMPQSAILGMHTIKERPIAENGEVVIRPMMYIALSYDHRIIDGKDAVQFLVAVKDALEDPSRLLLGL
ncbi:2-oxoglutarate dehydrogenase complex dihydrolipoyllysine-residue succinyltransferase [Wenzhouxiangella marina]|uniref:Dihydrolipoyllysine-residue succinyltransferase component of 2-oxoglutarate dehydrogenase complex n=1 Tax=Wenzhouxiangella marina TaxID=1579979 RepID=A0A0K0XW50_9GAMM|nr:2-oxoglutarate dehydrogenase complex dihydrolipoyllysine-residue succinyltransferase [Wenzhouxiangella marina]AKS41900.1 dihydrolipoamide succinyltransferase [Wenzhouxiangella marina]MBB6086333.1 2-oxoglutarate dehydrogenase E2 component (dihydrolipoamide succinyltransferase) [Wenzhouxiangella marina]